MDRWWLSLKTVVPFYLSRKLKTQSFNGLRPRVELLLFQWALRTSHLLAGAKMLPKFCTCWQICSDKNRFSVRGKDATEVLLPKTAGAVLCENLRVETPNLHCMVLPKHTCRLQISLLSCHATPLQSMHAGPSLGTLMDERCCFSLNQFGAERLFCCSAFLHQASRGLCIPATRAKLWIWTLKINGFPVRCPLKPR